jgi:tRNA pseudouridine55 synthase
MLGCLGHVESLRRLRVGPFTADNAISLEALERLVGDDSLPQALIPVGTALEGLPSLALTDPQAARIRAGQTVRVAPNLLIGEAVEDDPTIRAMAAGRVVALARLHGSELSPLRVFNL